MNFSLKELARYRRQLELAGFGLEAQTALKKGSVLVIGAGGLGCPALLYLAAAGVGRMTVVDPDTVDVSNLQRQVLYTTDELGTPKAEAAARRLRSLNPEIRIDALVSRFRRDLALSLAEAHDVVVDGSDNFATRYLANDACVLAGRPLVYGAIRAYEGQVSVFNWRGGPTYRCLYPEPPAAGTEPGCIDTGVLGVLPGLIGTMQAAEALKLLTGIGDPLSGRLLLWNALTMRSREIRFSALPENRLPRELPPDEPGEGCPASYVRTADEIAVEELPEDLTSLQWIDVRESWERSLEPLARALSLPFSLLGSGGAPALLLSLDRNRRTIVVCNAGPRGLHAAEVLRRTCGLKDVKSLRGGYRSVAPLLGKGRLEKGEETEAEKRKERLP